MSIINQLIDKDFETLKADIDDKIAKKIVDKIILKKSSIIDKINNNLTSTESEKSDD